MSNPYRSAAARVRTNWVQGSWRGADGTKACLVQALTDATGQSMNHLTPPVQEALHQELCAFLDYRVICILQSNYKYKNANDRFITWNDAFWRRQSTVVRVLESLADKYDLTRAEELQVEISLLQSQIRDLKAQLAASQAENAVLSAENKRLWHKLRKQFAHDPSQAADRMQLAELEAQLATTWDELQAVAV